MKHPKIITFFFSLLIAFGQTPVGITSDLKISLISSLSIFLSTENYFLNIL